MFRDIVPDCSNNKHDQRAIFILALFMIYIAASIYIVKITSDLIKSGARQVAEKSLKVVEASLVAREQQLSNQVTSSQLQIEELERQRDRSSSALEAAGLITKISEKRFEQANLQRELAGVRARQQSLQDTHLLIGNVLSELNKMGAATTLPNPSSWRSQPPAPPAAIWMQLNASTSRDLGRRKEG